MAKARQTIAPLVTDRQAEVLRLARDAGGIYQHQVPSASTWRVCVNNRWLKSNEDGGMYGLTHRGVAALTYFDTVTA